MTSLGEMATYLPITGSFAEYSKRFVDPALGFAMGWNYWFNWAITLAVDLSTAALVLKFWFPHVPGWLFSLAALVIIFLINALSVKSFGEAEYWMALIKVITVIVFLIVGLLTIIGILGGHAVFLENFAYKKAPFVGGIPTVLSVFVVAGFSFQGTELIGITAGETENPEKACQRPSSKFLANFAFLHSFDFRDCLSDSIHQSQSARIERVGHHDQSVYARIQACRSCICRFSDECGHFDVSSFSSELRNVCFNQNVVRVGDFR